MSMQFKTGLVSVFRVLESGSGWLRWVSNATRHPSHLRKRFLVRTQELWDELDPVFQGPMSFSQFCDFEAGYKYAESEKDLLIKDRTGRTILASMTLLFQKYYKGVSITKTNRQFFSTNRGHLLKNTLSHLSDDDESSKPIITPRMKEKKIKEMNSYLKKTLKPIKHELISLKYRDDEDSVIECLHLGKRVMYEIEKCNALYIDWIEYPQCCHFLQRIGRVAYNYEDKQWIFDAYTPLIQSLAKQIPPELELLTTTQLMNAFYGLACLGPKVLDLRLEGLKGVYLIDELMERLLLHALEVMDDLNGMDRCLLIEGVILMNKRLTPGQLEVLLHDAYPLLKIRQGPGVVHSDQLASLLWAMGHHEACEDHWHITKTFLREMKDHRRFLRLKPADMSRSVFGLSKLSPVEDYGDYLEKIRRYFQFTVDLNQRHLFIQEVVEFAQGLAQLSRRPRGVWELMDYLLRDISKRQIAFQETQKDEIIKACIAIDYPKALDSFGESHSCDIKL